jgi:hypothetical protein
MCNRQKGFVDFPAPRAMVRRMSIQSILTHPGGAHKDDFLACCLLAYTHGVTIQRREPEEADLQCKTTVVVDVGGLHEPENQNFDHHQFPQDHPPTCALSLVLQHLGLYEDAQQFCEWLETSEWLDARGLVRTAKWLGVERSVVTQLNSPVDVTLLRRFASGTEHQPDEVVYEVMRMIGEDLVLYLQGMRKRMNFIAENASVWELESGFSILFIPRTDPLPAEPSSGLARYIEHHAPNCIGMVYPDRRGGGYGLSRHNDDLRLDFTRTEACDDVHFAHRAGFITKTSATEETRLRELLAMAWVG